MTNRRFKAASFGTVVFVAGVLGAAVASASPATPPGPGEQGCGAHTDALNCWANTGPVTPGETAFINLERGLIPGDDTRLLQVARGTCQMLVGGDTTSFIVEDVSQQLGVSPNRAGSTMDAAMETACPGLVVGADGAAHPG
jgi:hypothetical protein